MTPTEGVIISRMARGLPVSFDEFTESLYGDREDGGPLDPDNVIAVTVARIRKKFQGTPFHIGKRRQGQFTLCFLGKTIDIIADKIISEGKTTKPD